MEKNGAGNKDKNKSIPLTTVVIVLSLVIFLVWGINYYLLRDDPHRGTFGDMFGTVNSLFSGFALLGIIIAIILQKIELGLQREELQSTREEIKAQTEALKQQEDALRGQNQSMIRQADLMRAQSVTLEVQRFENKFFQLLGSQRELARTLYFPSGDKTGINGFQTAFKLMNKSASFSNRVSSSDDFPVWLKLNEKKFMLPIKQYFDSLENILDFLNKGLEYYPTEKNRDFYTNALRSHMSVYELYWIAVYCCSHFGEDTFKERVLSFKLLRNLPFPEGKINNYIGGLISECDID